jgi:hypothetical protein
MKQLWISSNLACPKRLKVMIPLWMPFYKQLLTEPIKNLLLLQISPSTIDKGPRKINLKHKKLSLSTTKQGSLIKKQIPIKTNRWNESHPGFFKADTVAHCGHSHRTLYLQSLPD